MMMSKADLRDAIAAEAKRCQGIADYCKKAASDEGEEGAEKYGLTYKSYIRKIKLLKELNARLDRITLEEGETDLANIKNSV